MFLNPKICFTDKRGLIWKCYPGQSSSDNKTHITERSARIFFLRTSVLVAYLNEYTMQHFPENIHRLVQSYNLADISKQSREATSSRADRMEHSLHLHYFKMWHLCRFVPRFAVKTIGKIQHVFIHSLAGLTTARSLCLCGLVEEKQQCLL